MAAAAKSRTSLFNALSLTAGAGNQNSSWINLSTAIGARISGKITNGATGPTVAAQVQLQTANDWNSGSPTLPINEGGAWVGTPVNNDVINFTYDLSIAVAAVRLVAGSNTGQAVTVDFDISVVTGIA
jgi:hypothetical protein